MKEALSKIEVVFLDDNYGWFTQVVTVPEKIAKTESQDAFLKWVYSEEGEEFRDSWAEDVSSVYVWAWRGDLETHSDD